jgi:ABC-type Fe3+/spermidine/putrescine transport system ATPase subunit
VRAYLRIEIRRLHQRLGVTTIMVTHDQEEALTMADRIVVMNEGAIEQVGTPTEVYRRPASAFVADFVGTTNFLPGIVVGPDRVRFGEVDLACELDLRPGPGHDVTLPIRPEDVVVRNVVPRSQHVHRARRGNRVSGPALSRRTFDRRRETGAAGPNSSINCRARPGDRRGGDADHAAARIASGHFPRAARGQP